MGLFNRNKCEHDDEIIDKEVFKSPFEIARAASHRSVEMTSVPDYFFRASVVYVFKCKKCNRTRTEQHYNL